MRFKTVLILLFLLSLALKAGEEDYIKGIKLYLSKQYDKAFPIIHNEAKQDNKAAQYRLAEMYKHGYGVKQDFKQAMYWYKLSAGKYAYIESDMHDDKNSSYISHVQKQLGDESIVRGSEFVLAKMNTKTPEIKQLLRSLAEGGFFGLQPYRTNFLLPVSYSKEKPLRVSSAFHPDNLPAEFQNTRQYSEHTEVEFQFSLKKQLFYDLFGFNEFVYLAYTQKVWWQLYSDSSPFRETDYLPEFFVIIPSLQNIDETLGLKAFKVGFLHESNGQEGYRSRSWNRLYATALWQWQNLFLATRLWYRIPESEKTSGYYDGLLGPDYANENGDDNPDIEKYMGYGDIKIDYLNGKSKFSLLLRDNFRLNSDNKGAVEFSWSYPFFDSPNTFWYVKIFHGYGNSLIDYNKEVSKAAFGFSFSRGLF